MIEAQLGDLKVLLEHDQLGLKYFPDGPVSVLPGTPEAACRMTVPAGIWTYLVEGESLGELNRATRVLEPGEVGEFDNGYTGINSIYCHGDGKLYGFYHAEDQEEMPQIGGGVPGFFCSIGLVVSEDSGFSWQKLGQVITSGKPKDWAAFADQPDRGAGEVSVVVSRDGEHLLAYYTEHSRLEGRGVQICLARADIADGPPLPGAWKKYRHGRFDQPGIGGGDAPVLSASHMDNADAIFPHVTYSQHLGRYVMVFNINIWKEFFEGDRRPERSGIYVAYSTDGIEWSEPEMLVGDFSVCKVGISVSWHPTVVWSDDKQHVGWLVYSHSERWGHVHEGDVPHYMVGREIEFKVKGAPKLGGI